MERSSFYNSAIATLETNCFWRSGEDDSELYNDCLLDGFNWECGASKVVIIMDDSVLKTSFSGYIEYSDDDVDYIEDDEDLCEVEFLVYEAAVNEGVEKFFAKTERVAVGVYEQEKCVISCNDLRWNIINTEKKRTVLSTINIPEFNKKENSWNKLEETAHEFNLSDLLCRVRHSEVFSFLLLNYDIKDLLKLQNFLNKYDINDIHGHNAGVFSDGTIKIFDFSGFESSTSSKFYD